MKPTPYFLFTHTPLHVGAGHSVGYVDLPIQREVHTDIPIVPGSSLKGVLRDLFESDAKKTLREQLFGHDTDEKEKFRAGALLLGEARVLCFPVRSAKGCFAWVTCPLVLERARRDGVVGALPDLAAVKGPDADGKVLGGANLCLDDDGRKKIVLEEYTFTAQAIDLGALENALCARVEDPVWKQLPGRLVVASDGVFSHFVRAGCSVDQHVRINDATGTADDGALFNEETVPSETFFYGMLGAQTIGAGEDRIEAETALAKLKETVAGKPLQIGGGETTGLGWCTLAIP